MATQPAPVVTSPVMECVVQGNLAAGGSSAVNCGNVFFYRLQTQVLAPTRAAFGAVFDSVVVAALLAAANIRYTPVRLLVRRLDQAVDPYAVIALAGAGAIATESLVGDSVVVMKLNSAYRGKTMRGFKYLGGLSEVDTIGDVLTGAGLARWQTVRAALAQTLVDSLGNSWVPFIRSRYLEQTKVDPTTIRGTDVVAVLMNLTTSDLDKRKSRSVLA